MARSFTAEDAWAFNAGTHVSAYEVLGAHVDGDETAFQVWAPNASAVAVVGDMNGWSPTAESALDPDPSVVWRGRLSAGPGQRYKFRISPKSGKPFDKADPFAFVAEEAPATASLIWDGSYEWNDHAWTSRRGGRIALDAPVSIYEVHLGSWRYEPGPGASNAEEQLLSQPMRAIRPIQAIADGDVVGRIPGDLGVQQ